jgi:hypothetical protein
VAFVRKAEQLNGQRLLLVYGAQPCIAKSVCQRMNFPKPFLLFFALFTNAAMWAQPDRTQLIGEINRDVWIPFITGVNTNQSNLYNGVNAPDFHWVRSGTTTRIMNLAEYIEDARVVMEGRAAKGIQTEIEVRFLERHVSAAFAAEKCVIRFTSREPGKEPSTSYAIMQQFLRKENGRWQKTIQYAHREPTTAEVFQQAEPMQ